MLVREGRAVGLRCISMELTEPDSSGRQRPVPIPGSEYDLEVDQIIPAIGQRPDLSAIEEVTGLQFTRWGTTEVDPVTYATGRDGVFAGGDLQTGPWVAIGAIAAGREAAESIVRYLDGRDMAEGREVVEREPRVPADPKIPRQNRVPNAALPVEKRAGNFEKWNSGMMRRPGGRSRAVPELRVLLRMLSVRGRLSCQCGGSRQTYKERKIEVGSVILCPGSEPFDPSGLEEYYHYKSIPMCLPALNLNEF